MNRLALEVARMLLHGVCLLAGILLLAGCASVEKNADRPTEPKRERWASELRMPTAKGQMTGIDERARQIERDLGIQ